MSKCLQGWIALLLVLLTSVVAYGQNAPAGRWWRSQKIVKQLGLTGGEIQQLERAFEASRLKMIKLKSRVEQEQFKLQSMVEKRKVNEAKMKAQHRRLEEARTSLADERFAFFVQVRNIIGYERFQKLLDMAPGRRK